MNRHISLFFLGIIVILMPLSGFPIFWKGTFEVAAGLAIAIISGMLYRDSVVHSGESHEKIAPHQRTYIDNH